MQTATLKHFALRFLPGPALQVLRRRHYARKLVAAEPEPEMAFLPFLAPAGSTVLDLGANFPTRGSSPTPSADRPGSRGRARSGHLRRPSVERPSASARLRASPSMCCLDRAGTATMAVPQYHRGGENLYEARIVDGAGVGPQRTVEVLSRRLDDLFGDGDRIAFVKCDVEGHELRVLRGAGTIRLGHRPAWLIEVSGDPDDRRTAAYHLMGLMVDGGYTTYRLDGGRLVVRRPGDRAVNYFFLRPEHVARVPAHRLA